LEEGTWSNLAPTCFKGCIAPPISPYLVITPKEPEYNTGAIVGVSCTSGFSLQGNATLQCQEDLTWGSNLPQCAIGKIKTIRIQKYAHFTHWYFVKLLGLFGIIAKVLSNCLFYAQYIHAISPSNNCFTPASHWSHSIVLCAENAPTRFPLLCQWT